MFTQMHFSIRTFTVYFTMGKRQTVAVPNWNIHYPCSSQFFNQFGPESCSFRGATSKTCSTTPSIHLRREKMFKYTTLIVICLKFHRHTPQHTQNSSTSELCKSHHANGVRALHVNPWTITWSKTQQENGVDKVAHWKSCRKQLLGQQCL